MKPFIIAVAGPMRSGKDTFINSFIRASKSFCPSRQAFALSSILPVKDAIYDALSTIGKGINTEDVPSDKLRRVLHETKASLDKHFNFTAELARHTLAAMPDSSILLYQVREGQNLEKLAHLEDVEFLSVCLTRRGMDYSGLEFEVIPDNYRFSFNIDSHLDDMTAWAALILARVKRVDEGHDTSDSYPPLTIEKAAPETTKPTRKVKLFGTEIDLDEKPGVPEHETETAVFSTEIDPATTIQGQMLVDGAVTRAPNVNEPEDGEVASDLRKPVYNPEAKDGD